MKSLETPFGGDPSQVKLVRIINRQEFTNKRAFLRIESELLTQLLDGPNGSKLKVGYRTVPFRILSDQKPNLTCHHCDQPGHRGYERVSRPDDGREPSESSNQEWKLICKNRCSDCTANEEGELRCSKRALGRQKQTEREDAAQATGDQ